MYIRILHIGGWCEVKLQGTGLEVGDFWSEYGNHFILRVSHPEIMKIHLSMLG